MHMERFCGLLSGSILWESLLESGARQFDNKLHRELQAPRDPPHLAPAHSGAGVTDMQHSTWPFTWVLGIFTNYTIFLVPIPSVAQASFFRLVIVAKALNLLISGSHLPSTEIIGILHQAQHCKYSYNVISPSTWWSSSTNFLPRVYLFFL